MNVSWLVTTGLCLGLGATLSSGCVVEYEGFNTDYQEIVNGQLNPGDPAVGFFLAGAGACTGTMISNRVMLTARHCVLDANNQPRPTSNMGVFWTTTPAQGDPFTPVLAFEFHPAADMAALHLDSANIPAAARPVPLNQRDLTPYIGQEVRITGYGLTASNGDSGTKLQGVTELLRVQTVEGAGDIMMIGQVGSKTCNGDSGGPAFMTFDGVEYIAGVTSFGTSSVCEAVDTLDGQVRVDVYYDWIVEFASRKDPNGLPAASLPQPAPAPADTADPVPNPDPAVPGSVTPETEPDAVREPASQLSGGCSSGGQNPTSVALLLLATLALFRRRLVAGR